MWMSIQGPGSGKFTLRRQQRLRKSERSRTDYQGSSSFGGQVKEKGQGNKAKESLRKWN